MRRVVVTGLGVVSPLGCGVDTNWRRLAAGECGFKRIDTFEASDLACQIAAVVPRAGRRLPLRSGRLLSRFPQGGVGSGVAGRVFSLARCVGGGVPTRARHACPRVDRVGGALGHSHPRLPRHRDLLRDSPVRRVRPAVSRDIAGPGATDSHRTSARRGSDPQRRCADRPHRGAQPSRAGPDVRRCPLCALRLGRRRALRESAVATGRRIAILPPHGTRGIRLLLSAAGRDRRGRARAPRPPRTRGRRRAASRRP